MDDPTVPTTADEAVLVCMARFAPRPAEIFALDDSGDPWTRYEMLRRSQDVKAAMALHSATENLGQAFMKMGEAFKRALTPLAELSGKINQDFATWKPATDHRVRVDHLYGAKPVDKRAVYVDHHS